MLQGLTLPGSLSAVLTTLRPCFTAPTFRVFTALVAGLLAQPVQRTVCGMLTGAGLARVCGLVALAGVPHVDDLALAADRLFPASVGVDDLSVQDDM